MGFLYVGFFLIAKRFFFKKPPVKTAAKQTLCSSVFKYIWFQIPNNYSHWIKVDSNPIGAALQVSIGQRLTQNTKKTPQNSHTKFFLVSFFLSRLAETSYHWKKKKTGMTFKVQQNYWRAWPMNVCVYDNIRLQIIQVKKLNLLLYNNVIVWILTWPA